jgi:hypothetical protein
MCDSPDKLAHYHILSLLVWGLFQLRIEFNFKVLPYGCETWSLTLREEPRLRVFENRVLRRMFGPKRDEVVGGWRKLQNEELHSL